MTNRILHNSTAIAVLLHAVLGCCSHACEHGSANRLPHGSTVIGNCDGCCDHGSLAGRATPQPSDGHRQPGGHEPCHEQSCHFFSTAKTDLTLDFSLAMDLPVPGDAVSSLASLGDFAGDNSGRDRSSPGEPLRTQTQVWLL